MSDGSLKDVLDALDDIKAILLLTNNTAIDEAKKRLLKDGSEERKVYDLCDGKTTEEIIAATGKAAGNIRGVLTNLRHKGLIKTVDKGDKKVHEQRF